MYLRRVYTKKYYCFLVPIAIWLPVRICNLDLSNLYDTDIYLVRAQKKKKIVVHCWLPYLNLNMYEKVYQFYYQLEKIMRQHVIYIYTLHLYICAYI